MARALVPRTRNAGTMTEAGFWRMIKTALRRRSVFWKPRLNALDQARRPYNGSNPRLKWEYQCNECKKYFPAKQVEVDHIDDVGDLVNALDLTAYIEKLFCEQDKLQVLCTGCHDKKTYKTDL
jgi:5-methylcytosine-specific restriction endonuclease McrA